MPIDWVTYQKIRYMYISEKKKVRAIARELSMSRKTIRKYCLGEQQPDTRKTYVHTSSPIEETAKKQISILLEENKNLPRKQKRNAKDIWEYLQDKKGIPLAQSTIRRYVRMLKNEMPDVFIPLEHGPGESMQFDWGDMKVYMENTKTVISLFCIALPHSGAIAGFVYPDKTMLSFIDGHIQAFTFFNGVAKRCVYDNLKTAVLKGYGQHAVKQTAFMRIESHYAFESVFCNIASGWEKSSVENAVSIIRRIAFTPIPHVDSYETLQEHVINKCLQYNKNHTIQGREHSIDQLLQNEKKHLMPLPSVPLDPGYSTRVLVHPDLTVVYEGTHYSVPHILAGKIVTLVPSPFHIKIFYQGKEMWKHTRTFKKHHHQYVLEHYLEILQQKPRAINQARPILKGIMPKECSDFLRLSRMENSNQQLIDILLLGRHIPQDKLLWAVEQANNTHNPSFQLVKFFLDIEDFAAEPDTIAIDHKDLEMYDALIPEGGDA